MRFVIVSFLFMGWAFWELSGGSDFEPRGLRSPEPVKVTAARPKPAPIVDNSAVALVAKQAIAPAKTPDKPAAENPAPDTQPQATSEEQIARIAQASQRLVSGLSLLSDSDTAQTFQLASLEQGAASLVTREDEPAEAPETAEPAPETVPQAPDIREVAGTRVNMRDGPGTVFPIIARLNIGHQVEILGESGTGWYRLRVLPEQHVGWVAASLISKKPD